MRFFLVCVVMIVGLSAKPHLFANALIHEHSPYLQQHAHNPVAWYPWGKEALEKAGREHKPIFLSIGYSTCHWCHVMEEESFTDSEVARLLNEHFVSIKVDREEYPQIDKKYQQIFEALRKRRGGWPLSVFLTPELEVIDIRTYIPKEEGYGSEGMLNLLPKISALYHDQTALQKRLVYNHKRLHDKAPRSSHSMKRSGEDIARQLHRQFMAVYDPKNGGFASHPKFPEASRLSLLLTLYRLYGDKAAYEMANVTLRKMAHGGIYDQIGGGFFRYSVDEAWQIPHFEKMLYTNAELVSLYTEAYLLSGEPLYRRVVVETIDEMLRHYRAGGVFASASDADSQGEEGGYYLYSYEKIKNGLIKRGWQHNEAEEALEALGIEEDGNIDGELSLAHLTTKNQTPKVGALKEYLRQIRSKRRFPFVDTKINTAWNAMMIKALFDASKIDRHYLHQAKNMMEKLWHTMRKGGILYHQKLPGTAAERSALLEDYAYLIKALTSGYMRTYAPLYLKRAQTLLQEARRKFYKNGIWYLSDDDIATPADFDDRYYTAPLSILFDGMLDLASLQEDLLLYYFVTAEIGRQSSLLTSDPIQAPQLAYEALRLHHGDVIIHAPKEKLLLAQKYLDHVLYPFVLSKVQATSLYLACRIDSCFAQVETIKKLTGILAQQRKPTPEKRGKRWQRQ
jgi:uncharacterized protein YyaL (SSP411 family)